MHLVGKPSTFFHQLFWDIHLPFLCLCLCQHVQILDYVINKADESDHFFSRITVVQAMNPGFMLLPQAPSAVLKESVIRKKSEG